MRRCRAHTGFTAHYLGLGDDDELIVAHTLLGDLLGVSQHGGIKGLVALEVAERQRNGGCGPSDTYVQAQHDTLPIPPVARAMLARSSLVTRRTAIAPASTKYLRHRSSIPCSTSRQHGYTRAIAPVC
jgi:hypothetical protein